MNQRSQINSESSKQHKQKQKISVESLQQKNMAEAMKKNETSSLKNHKNRKQNKALMKNIDRKTIHQNQTPIFTQKQSKLTSYWKNTHNVMNDSVSKTLSKTNAPNITNKDYIRHKMEDEIKQKNSIIEKMKKQKQVLMNKYYGLQNQSCTYKTRAKDVLLKSIVIAAEFRRQERAQIDPNFGYYKKAENHTTVFLQGKFMTQLKAKIKAHDEKIKQFESKAPTKSQDTANQLEISERILYKKCLQRELKQLIQQLKMRELLLEKYKERLRLAQKQRECKYAKQKWPLIQDRFQPLQLLGSGGFGEVYKAFDAKTSQYVALKISQVPANGKNQHAINAFLKHVTREVEIQKNLNHPNIAKLIQVIQISASNVSFVMQYCEGPQLSKYLRKNHCIEQKEAKQIIKQILNALKYLYEQNNKIIHYDLKPSNIIFHQGTIKILDFGLCKEMDTQDTKIDLTSQGAGTYYYLPPETFGDDQKVSCKVDIWSVGVIFFQLLYGIRPFCHGVKQQKILVQGLIKNAKKVQFPAQTALKTKVSDQAKKFILACLKYHQEQRLNPLQAYQHEYFTHKHKNSGPSF